jgi:3-phenylpropionate/trans-cinnamate dioxygenase ferredoxin component
VPLIDVCPAEELPPGTMKLVPAGSITVGVYNCDGSYYALEDRCSHDDGPLVEGDWDPDSCVVTCPRHGATFDIASGRPLTLPAYLPVETFPVVVEEGIVKVDVR